MSEEQTARILDLIPVKKYRTTIEEYVREDEVKSLHTIHSNVEVILASDLELFLQKLTQPKNLTKLMTSLALNKKPDLEEFLKWPNS